MTLAAPHVYSGGTTLAAGTLAATGPENLGGGPVTLPGGVLAIAAINVPLAINHGFNINVFTPSITPPNDTIDGTYFFYQGGMAGRRLPLGLPVGGGLMSLSNTNVTFQLAATPTMTCRWVPPPHSGTLILANSATFTQLNILNTDGSGSKPFNVVLNFANGTQSTYNVSGSDWFGDSPYAIRAGPPTPASIRGTSPLQSPALRIRPHARRNRRDSGHQVDHAH